MKKIKGIFGTFIYHCILILVIVFFGFSTPLPLPGEDGILINFGTDESGFGEIEPAYSDLPDNQEIMTQQEVTTPESENKEILTQDFEESAPVKEEKVTLEKQTIKKDVVPETVTETKEEVITQPVVEERKVNEQALYKGRSSTSESTGSEGITQGDGNQGSITGSPDSDNYSSGLSQGSGGVEFSLAGRNPLFLPKPKYEYQVEGKVVVEIRVDRNGNVTYARAGVKGSTTNEDHLIKAAQEAALKARFDSKSDAAYTQTGTITYHFILQ
jgi:colicin import membrane protein